MIKIIRDSFDTLKDLNYNIKDINDIIVSLKQLSDEELIIAHLKYKDFDFKIRYQMTINKSIMAELFDIYPNIKDTYEQHYSINDIYSLNDVETYLLEKSTKDNVIKIKIILKFVDKNPNVYKIKTKPIRE